VCCRVAAFGSIPLLSLPAHDEHHYNAGLWTLAARRALKSGVVFLCGGPCGRVAPHGVGCYPAAMTLLVIVSYLTAEGSRRKKQHRLGDETVLTKRRMVVYSVVI
jgi:hypothetical protein